MSADLEDLATCPNCFEQPPAHKELWENGGMRSYRCDCGTTFYILVKKEDQDGKD